MKIVKPSVELLWITQEPEKYIEIAGRTCYKSEDKITPTSNQEFAHKICNVVKHHSVVEHACACFKFVTDRGVTHELVRHRIASFSQESTRYCNYGNDKFGNEISVIEPPFMNEKARASWEASCLESEKRYFEMLENGCKPQIARSILPTCLKTEIVVTANFREWLHIFKMRCAENAHPQIIEIMKVARQIMNQHSPTIFKLED